MSLHLELPDELVAAVADAVAERLRPAMAHGDGRSPWMTVEEAAEYLRWSRDRVYKLTSARAIPHRKHEGRLLFNRHELDGWLDGYREGPLPLMQPGGSPELRGNLAVGGGRRRSGTRSAS